MDPAKVLKLYRDLPPEAKGIAHALLEQLSSSEEYIGALVVLMKENGPVTLTVPNPIMEDRLIVGWITFCGKAAPGVIHTLNAIRAMQEGMGDDGSGPGSEFPQ